jgi:ribonuclease P protein component
LECAKAGLTTPRRLGNAVARNLLRRRMREAIRHEIWRAQPGWAFVFHPRAAAAEAPMEKIRAELERVFRRTAR